jgi:FlgD Ig-like domain
MAVNGRLRQLGWSAWLAIVVCGSALLTLGAVVGRHSNVTRRTSKPPPEIPVDAPPSVALPPTQVSVSKSVVGGEVVYHYRLVNGSAFPITALLVGFDYFKNQAELRMFENTPAPSETTSPPGWHLEMQPTEEDSVGNVAWVVNDPGYALGGGSSLSGFSLRTAPDTLLEKAHWTVFVNSAEQDYYSGVIQNEANTGVRDGDARSSASIRVTPNPASGHVSIAFDVLAEGQVIVEVFDAAGRKVRELMSKTSMPGAGAVLWDGRNGSGAHVPAGTYFVRVATSKTQRFARITLVR